MKRKLFILAAALCLLTATLFCVQAAPARLVDDAQLLTSDEQADITAQLDEISVRQGMDVVIVTVASTQGKSPMDFADDYYDYNGYAPDGILLLVSMEDRDWWISTTGYGITAFTDAGIDYIGEEVVYYLSDEYYDLAFSTFAQLCDQFITQAKTGAPYDQGNMPKVPFSPLFTLVIAVVAGLIVAAIATGIMKSKLKSVRFQAKADSYVIPGSMQLTRSNDFFLYSHLSKVEKPQNTGGSSTHTSSSGRSHGGGGGKF